MTPVQIAAVVVTYQSSSTIDACLARLRAAEGISEIRVVDNASSDDTLVVVQRHALADARLHFIANPDNPGFASACNQGARDSQAPWLVFINPDLMVERDTLAQLCARAVGHAAVLLGVEQVDEHGQPDAAVRRRDPDFAAMLRAPRAAAQLAVPADPSAPLQVVDAISGALMLMQRSLFDRLDGWDGAYRLHAEDRPVPACASGRCAGGGGQRSTGRARARRVQSCAAVLCRVAQTPRPVALFPQVRGGPAGAAHPAWRMAGDLTTPPPRCRDCCKRDELARVKFVINQ